MVDSTKLFLYPHPFSVRKRLSSMILIQILLAIQLVKTKHLRRNTVSCSSVVCVMNWARCLCWTLNESVLLTGGSIQHVDRDMTDGENSHKQWQSMKTCNRITATHSVCCDIMRRAVTGNVDGTCCKPMVIFKELGLRKVSRRSTEILSFATRLTAGWAKSWHAFVDKLIGRLGNWSPFLWHSL